MIELVHSEDFSFRHITGSVLIHKDHEDNTFSAGVYVNELLEQIYMSGFATQDAAERWAWDRADKEDNELGE